MGGWVGVEGVWVCRCGWVGVGMWVYATVFR